MNRRPIASIPMVMGLLLAWLGVGCGSDPQGAMPDGLLGDLAAGAIHMGALDPGREACAPYLGSGWLKAEETGDGVLFRWTGAETATLQLEISEPGSGRIVLHGYALYGEDRERRGELLINGHSLGEAILPASLETATWPVPAGVMGRGGNVVELRIDRTVSPAGDTRSLGVLVDWLGFVPEGEAAYDNPYEEAPTAELTAAKTLSARLHEASGAFLVLTWSPTPHELAVSLVEGSFDAGFNKSLPGDAGACRLRLPPNLPEGVRVIITGEGTSLLSATLERPES